MTLTPDIWQRVTDTLAAADFHVHAAGFDRRRLIGMANDLGGPPMDLLHWRVLEELGRLPGHGEGRTVDALEGIDSFGAPFVEIFMVSHRWLRPALDPAAAHPDDESHAKAQAIHEFSLWRRQWVRHRHGFDPEIFYWIDYCCIDQTRSQQAIPLLPLWIACCERFLRFETPDYHDRTWCRLEPLLSYVFSFADHHTVIDAGFRNRWPDTGTESLSPLLDPATGLLTDPRDRELILPLVELATATRPTNPERTGVTLGGTAVKCYRL